MGSFLEKVPDPDLAQNGGSKMAKMIKKVTENCIFWRVFARGVQKVKKK